MFSSKQNFSSKQFINLNYDATTSLINHFLSEKEIPEKIATSRLFVLNKNPQETARIDNLRPIMINSPIRKILEAIILASLEEQLNQTGKIHKAQTGFTAGCGTSVNLLKFMGDIMDIRNRQSSTSKYYICFIDFKAAFDSVIHHKLYELLEKAGVDQETINRVKLLYNHAHFAVNESNRKPINIGVLQGSLISPILFNLYINELLILLSKELGDQNVYCYADDLMFVCLGKYSLGKSIRIIREWGVENNLHINPKKCAIMRVRKKINAKDEKEKAIEGIEFKNTYKFLGIQVESSLTLGTQIKSLKQSIRRISTNFFKLKQNISGVKIRLELWKTYLKSVLEYGVENLALFPKKIDKVERTYYTSLKKALAIPLNISNSKLTKAVGIFDIRTIIHLRFLKVYIKMRRRNLHIPESVETIAQEICDKMGIKSPLDIDFGEIIVKFANRWYQSHHGDNANYDDHNYPDGLYLTEEQNDWPLLYTLTGRIVPGIKYKITNCIHCQLVLTQKHLLDDCVEYNLIRNKTRETLYHYGIKLTLEEGFEDFIANLQNEPRIRNVGKLNKKLILSAIKKYVAEIRNRFIKSAEKED